MLISDPDPVNNKSARNNGPSLCLQRQMGLRPSLCHEHYVTRRVTHMTRTNCHGPGVTMPDCHSGYLNIILNNGSFDKRRFITCAKTRRIVSQRSEKYIVSNLTKQTSECVFYFMLRILSRVRADIDFWAGGDYNTASSEHRRISEQSAAASARLR